MQELANRTDLEFLLTKFYDVALIDEEIGHHFADLDMRTHLPTIIDFWDKNLFGSPVYFNNPLTVHQLSHAKSPLRSEHFVRWIEIFCDTVDRFFAGEVAELAKSRARAIADSLDQRLNGGVAIIGRKRVPPPI
jgi:Truncated hemoglobins